MTNDLTASQLNLVLINLRVISSNQAILQRQIAEYQASVHWWSMAALVWTIAGVIAFVLVSQRLKILWPLNAMVATVHEKLCSSDPDSVGDKRVQ
jgi:hypothetical protein